MKNVWHDLKKPILCLAPMDAVTDTVFRQIVASAGRPDLFFTEFTSVEALCSKGKKKVLSRLEFTSAEVPIIAQVWGLVPKNYFEVARDLKKRGFNGIDINMGCPVRDVVSRGACSGLIKNHNLASEIIKATQEGAGGLPVSVKTRIGLSTIETDEWIPFLLEHKLDALTVHLRTSKEMSEVSPHWEEMEKIILYRNKISPQTVIIANGGIKSRREGLEKIKTFGLDGVMIGTGIFQNIWVFNPKVDPNAVSLKEKLELLLKHTRLYEKVWGSTRDFEALKKFYKIYVSGFANASDLRVRLMHTKTSREVESIIREVLKHE